MRKLVGVALTLVLGIAACDSTAPVELGDPTAIAKISGDGQAGTGGAAVAEPFTVQVRGKVAGTPRPGVTVEWEIASESGGSLPTSQTVTDSAGLASVVPTLPNVLGATFTVRASLPGSTETVEFTATVAATQSGATSLQKARGDDQTGEPGATLGAPYVVKVVDGGGANVSGAEVDFSIRDGDGGSLSARTVTTGADGEAAVTATLPDDENVTQTVRATVASLRDTVRFTSSTTGAASAVTKVSGDDQSGTGGEALDDPFVVEVTDDSGNGLSGRTVEWSVTSEEGGTLTASETATDSAGRAEVTATLPNLEDAVMEVEASPGGLSEKVVFSATVVRTLSGADSLQRISGSDQVGEPNTKLSEPYVVRVLDGARAVVSGVEVLFWIREGDAGALSASTVTTDADGEAEVTATLPNRTNVTQTVRATVASLRDTVSFTSRTVPATSGPANVRVISGDDQKGIVRDTLLDPLRVEVSDSNGGAVGGASVRWRVVSDNGGSVRDSVTETDPEGLTETRWRLGNREGATDRVIAWIEPENADPDTATFTAEVTGVPDTIVVTQGGIDTDNNATAAPDTVVGDTVTVAPDHWSRKPFKATLEDASGREVRGVVLTWTVTSGGGTVGDEPDGDGAETVTVVTGEDGSVSVWRKASGSDSTDIGDWIGATVSVERFPDVREMILKALVR